MKKRLSYWLAFSLQSTKGGIGARLLVALFALGIVFIGFKPIEGKYGPAFYSFVEKTSAFVSQHLEVEPRPRRKIDEPEIRVLPMPKDASSSRGLKSAGPAHQHTKQDQKQLDSLLEGL